MVEIFGQQTMRSRNAVGLIPGGVLPLFQYAVTHLIEDEPVKDCTSAQRNRDPNDVEFFVSYQAAKPG